MKIVFNLQSTGLGNNGGSRTLIKCAENLQDLDHEVTLWCSANNYKWSKIKVPISSKMPKCDVIVATGYSSVSSTLAAKVKRKFYYIRGFELWRASEKHLIKSYRSMQCIVNSKWLQQYMDNRGIEAHLVYPGVDLDEFQNNESCRKRIVGGIFSKKHLTKRHDDVIAIGKKLKCETLLLNRDIRNPCANELSDFYNRIKVWVSPSELEGLHNCPMEASLCGCGLVATNHERGGTVDYAIHDETCLKYDPRDLKQAAQYVGALLEDDDLREKLQRNMVKLLHDHIGDRRSNMQKMMDIFQQ